jgi:hypothetical protein
MKADHTACSVRLVLPPLTGLLILWYLLSAWAQAAPPADVLAFRPAENGAFQFDTGVLRGELRAQGKALGLSSVFHVPSGTLLDRGRSGYGLCSHYRVFTSNKRYGGGAWDWPSTARLGENGTVEVNWAAATNRPFAMRAVYRWSAPDSLDVETIVEPNQALPKFESFLASYFADPFTNCLVYREGPAGEAPAFRPADRSLGDWQMVPRDAAVLPLIQDGRWQLEPNPVKWTLLPPLARPLVVRRAPLPRVTVALMAPASDCFAIASPQQQEGHYSVYLSLFGRDLQAGQTARARARLLVLGDFSPEKILQSYQAFSRP